MSFNSIIKKILSIDCISEHHFVTSLLGRESVVVDLGANKGEFFYAYKKKYEGRHILVEPNAKLFGRLDVSSHDKKFQVVVGGEDKTYTFYHSKNDEAGSLQPEMASQWVLSGSEQVQGLSWSSLLQRASAQAIDLLKVDIEGAELDLFSGMTKLQLSHIGQISCEFHDFMDTSQLPRVQAVIRHLRDSGFVVLNFSIRDHRDVLFVNTQRAGAMKLVLLHLLGTLLKLRR